MRSYTRITISTYIAAIYIIAFTIKTTTAADGIFKDMRIGSSDVLVKQHPDEYYEGLTAVLVNHELHLFWGTDNQTTGRTSLWHARIASDGEGHMIGQPYCLANGAGMRFNIATSSDGFIIASWHDTDLGLFIRKWNYDSRSWNEKENGPIFCTRIDGQPQVYCVDGTVFLFCHSFIGAPVHTTTAPATQQYTSPRGTFDPNTYNRVYWLEMRTRQDRDWFPWGCAVLWGADGAPANNETRVFQRPLGVFSIFSISKKGSSEYANGILHAEYNANSRQMVEMNKWQRPRKINRLNVYSISGNDKYVLLWEERTSQDGRAVCMSTTHMPTRVVTIASTNQCSLAQPVGAFSESSGQLKGLIVFAGDEGSMLWCCVEGDNISQTKSNSIKLLSIPAVINNKMDTYIVFAETRDGLVRMPFHFNK